MLGGQTLNYFAVPWAVVNNPLPLVVVTAIEVVLLGAVEKYRCALLLPWAAVLLCLLRRLQLAQCMSGLASVVALDGHLLL